jgi:hypothetical protein
MRTNILRNIFIVVRVPFALAQVLVGDTSEGVSNFSKMPLVFPQAAYTTFDIPNVPNPLQIGPNGINPAGAVVGSYLDTNFVGHGFLRAPDGVITTFDAPGAVDFGTNPIGNNPQGAITGSYFDGFTFHGFLRVPKGTITNVDPPGSLSTFPSVINPAGVIIGEFFDATGAAHGFVRTP